MLKIGRVILGILFFCLLTLCTQIGGLVYLASLFSFSFIKKKVVSRAAQFILKTVAFLILYFFTSFLVVPPVVKLFGRVQMPVNQASNLQPLNMLTCILNRNYVRPQLRDAAFTTAKQMSVLYPGTVLNYLDGSFPFINRFPLFPHLSHNDGKKLDLVFCYIDNETGKTTNKAPSPIGYGISELPRPDEVNTASLCAEKGYWQYSFLTRIVPQGNKVNYTFDSIRTKRLVEVVAAEKSIGKIFIEPHLKARLKLTTPKIRFHGCRAVRHDDHIHIQLI